MAWPAPPQSAADPGARSPRRHRPSGLIALLAGINILWAGSSLAAKSALGSPPHPGIPPMTLAFARFSLAAVLMYLVARGLRVDLRVARRDWSAFWVMGVLGLALTYPLAYAGLRRTTATDSSLLIATEPVFLAVLAWIFLREPMPGSKVTGIVAGLAGVSLIVTNGAWPHHLSGIAAGNLLIALGLIFEASASIVGKGLVARYPAVAVMTYQMTTGALGLAPFAVAEMIQTFRAGHSLLPPPGALLGLLYLVLPCTVFAYTVWYIVLDKHEAGELSVYLFIQPVVGALLGVLFQGDRVTAFTVGGALLVLLALALINRRPPLPETPPVPPTA